MDKINLNLTKNEKNNFEKKVIKSFKNLHNKISCDKTTHAIVYKKSFTYPLVIQKVNTKEIYKDLLIYNYFLKKNSQIEEEQDKCDNLIALIKEFIDKAQKYY